MNIEGLDWKKTEGLIPAIVQDWETGRVLMLGFMNRAALEKTLETRQVTFWSRTRQACWTKGETSGNYLELKEIKSDCDGDTLLLLAAPKGPVCHRETLSCFAEDDQFVALEFLSHLERLIQTRRTEMPSGSYTTELFNQGLEKIAKKVGEEAVEVVISTSQGKQRSVEETSDLLYHLLVFLVQQEIPLSDVVLELKRRHLTSNK
jgi:phosphoribosyl-AMP cyclohydrolase / phosphoribosyl-ATP pyrophosphohydrolase